MSRVISEHVKRKLYAESMGKCMNPNCQINLFDYNGDIIEKAHIRSYASTADNSFDNLIILCPNCHTNFDKNFVFKPEEVKLWKQIRTNEVESFFCKRFETFDDLKNEVFPLLLENKTIFESYYLSDNKKIWNQFEPKILANNSKLKKLLANNLRLIQRHSEKSYSNLELVHTFISHINEFEVSRLEEEKYRQILFPQEINSMFGVSPVEDFLLPSVESLELLISKLQDKNQFIDISLGNDNPYLTISNSYETLKIYLKDTPRIRQYYYDYQCFRPALVRLESLNFALKYINSRKVKFSFFNCSNLREIQVKDKKIIFIYEYCLSKASLARLCPEQNSIIVNLHNWNGESCISNEAYLFANELNVKLLDIGKFYAYINKLQ